MAPHRSCRRVASVSISILLLLTAYGCSSHNTISRGNDQVELRYKRPYASEVICAASIDQFSHHAAVKDDRGWWVCTIHGAGEFRYFYIVDGEVVLPECELTVLDDFGARNCIYIPAL